jgi:hypothetical protein
MLGSIDPRYELLRTDGTHGDARSALIYPLGLAIVCLFVHMQAAHVVPPTRAMR